jgi:glycerate kinase
MVKELDAGLRHLARIIKRDLKADIESVPGSGAAGGLGAGLMAFLGAKLRPGIDIVVDSVKLEQKLKGCSLVITGEGRMDGQTVFGKTPSGAAKVARKLGIPVIAISGCVGADVSKVRSIGIKAYFSALQEPVQEADLPIRGPDMLVDCAEQIARLMALDFKGRRNLRLRRGRS